MLQIFSMLEMAYAEMPFEADECQVIYVDNGIEHDLNHFVADNLPMLKTLFRRHGLEFCYMPAMFDDDADLREQIRYRIPWLKNVDLDVVAKLKAVDSKSLEAAINSKTDQAGVMYHGDKEEKVMKIDISDPALYKDQFRQIARAYGAKVARNMQRKLAADPDLENLFYTLLERKPKGVIRKIIEQALIDEEVLSRVVIEKDCSVYLPDYDRHIQLRPMEKTLFFLYLKHPEGIAFKDLVDYRTEIYHIYGHLSNQSDPAKVWAAVDRLFELDSNAANEHRSRMKTAFEHEFDSVLADKYYITGKKGEKMSITLPRHLVDWKVQF